MTTSVREGALLKSLIEKLVCTLTLVALLLVGCDVANEQVAGIDRGGYQGGTVGAVSGFGSVIVNGTHYGTGGAAISVNGVQTTEAELDVGYVVAILADFSGAGAQATVIDFSHNVIGPLSAVTAAANEVSVLGQSIVVNDATAYGTGIEPASVDGLALLPQGQRVRVSGLAGSDNEILATRIDLDAAGPELQVTGIVADIDTALFEFRIGGLVIAYGSASVAGFSGGEPAPGDRVEARGAQFGSSGKLIATEVKRKELTFKFEEADEFEIEGLITAFTSANSFRVSGIPVITDNETEYSGGNASMLALNVRIEVEGRLNGNGMLLAEEIEFRSGGLLRVEAAAALIDPVGGTLEILGIPVQTNSLTSFEDKSPAEQRPFSLADINPGEPLRVIGAESLDISGTIVATKIVRLEKLEGMRLKGIATDVDEPTFSILGAVIVTDSQTDIEGDFFDKAEGRLVEAIGDNSSGQFLAGKVELED